MPADSKALTGELVSRNALADASRLTGLISKLVRRHGSFGPVQHEQPLEPIIAADVVAPDGAERRFARPVRVAAEGERDALRMARQHFFHRAVAAERVPQQAVQAAAAIPAAGNSIRGTAGGA